MPIQRAKYKAADVARYIIYLASQEMGDKHKEREGISNLKLQKMLYFAQAYFLAKLNRALFSDAIEAWELGPVVRSVYEQYKKHKSNAIIEKEDTSSLSDKDKEIIKSPVWSTFGEYSARRLVDIAHAHPPWQEASKTWNKIISRQAIKDYYTSLFK